jgi:hypothetical protein
MQDVFNWTPVTDYKNENDLNELTAKGWKQYRAVHGLDVKNMGGVWMVSRGVVEDVIPDEVEHLPVSKLSVVSFGGLTVSNHAPLSRMEVNHNTFNMGSMLGELDSFNKQLEATDQMLSEATRLLQEKAVALEIATDEKRKRLSLLDDKILATRTQAKLLRDKTIVVGVESEELNRVFVGKQGELADVVSEVRSLLE